MRLDRLFRNKYAYAVLLLVWTAIVTPGVIIPAVREEDVYFYKQEKAFA